MSNLQSESNECVCPAQEAMRASFFGNGIALTSSSSKMEQFMAYVQGEVDALPGPVAKPAI